VLRHRLAVAAVLVLGEALLAWGLRVTLAPRHVLLFVGANVGAWALAGRLQRWEALRRTLVPEREPVAVPERVVGPALDPYAPPRGEHELMEMPLRVVGPLAKGPTAMREAGYCAECPAEFVIDPGGFMVSSPDPSARPGSIPYCYRRRHHKGRHTWQMEEAVTWQS
jgi:hypothetical protein